MPDFSKLIASIPGVKTSSTTNSSNTKSENNTPFVNSIISLGQNIINKAKNNPTNSNIITPAKIDEIAQQIETQKKALGFTGQESYDQERNMRDIKYSDGSELKYKKNDTEPVLNYCEKPGQEDGAGFELKTSLNPQEKREFDNAFVYRVGASSNFTLEKQGDENSVSENIYSSIGTDIHPDGIYGPSDVNVENNTYIRNTQK